MSNTFEQANVTTIANLTSSESVVTVPTLRHTVENTVKQYFNQMGNQEVTNLYDLVLAQVEEPLLKSVMEETSGNQSKAAITLGLSRGTLRKKLKTYDLL